MDGYTKTVNLGKSFLRNQNRYFSAVFWEFVTSFWLCRKSLVDIVLFRIMQRIAEKLEFMTGRVVKVCTKAGIGGRAEHKKHVFVQMFKKTVLKDEFLDSSKWFLYRFWLPSLCSIATKRLSKSSISLCRIIKSMSTSPLRMSVKRRPISCGRASGYRGVPGRVTPGLFCFGIEYKCPASPRKDPETQTWRLHILRCEMSSR